MICPECKTKNTDNSVFCKKCGRKFQTGKGFSGRKICIIAGVALVVIAAVVAFMQLVAEGELAEFPDIPWDSLSRLGISGAYNPQINFDQITVREDHKRAMLQAGTAYAIKNKSNYFWNEKGQLPNHEIFLPEDAEHHGLIDQKSGHTYIFSTLIHRRNPASQKDWSRTTSLFLAARISSTGPPRLVMAVPRAVGGDGRETEYFRGLTDLNGDGIPELWTSISGYEWWYYCAYELRNDGAVEIFRGGGGGL